MIRQWKKKLQIFTLTQLSILIISLVAYQEISFLSYINISFYFASALLLTSLLIYTIHSGFYDAISKSFNIVFSRGSKRKLEEVPSLSELVTMNEKPLVFHGLANGLFMLVALFIYYFLLT